MEVFRNAKFADLKVSEIVTVKRQSRKLTNTNLNRKGSPDLTVNGDPQTFDRFNSSKIAIVDN